MLHIGAAVGVGFRQSFGSDEPRKFLHSRNGKFLGVSRGQGPFSFARSSVATFTDDDGLVEEVEESELRIKGARRVKNYLRSSDDIDNAYWSGSNDAVAVDSNTLSLPTNGGFLYQSVVRGVVPGEVWIASCDLKGVAGEKIRLRIFRHGGGTTESSEQVITLTSEYESYAVSHTFANVQAGVRFDILRQDSMPHGEYARTVSVRRCQLENLTSRTVQEPGEYQNHGPEGSANLVTNGSMEVDSDWIENDDVEINELSTDQVHGGSTSRHLACTYGSWVANQNGVTQVVTVVAGAEYLISGWFYLVKGECSLDVNDAQVDEGSDAMATLTTTGVWTKLSFIGTPTGTSLTVKLVAHEIGDYDFYVDDVTVRRMDNVSAVSYYTYENGNTVDGDGVVTRARGLDITAHYAALYEPFQTENVVRESVDFTVGGDWSVQGDAEMEESSTLSCIKSKNWWRLQAVSGGSASRAASTHTHNKDAAAETWTGTVYIKKDEVDWVRLIICSNDFSKAVSTYFDLTNGVAGSTTETTWTHVESSIEETKTGSGIYRLRVTCTTDTESTIRLRFQQAEADLDVTINLNAGDGFFIQGTQLEEKAVATSLVITEGSATTRTADDGVPSFVIDNWNQAQGTLYVDLLSDGADMTGNILGTHSLFNSVLYKITVDKISSTDGTASSTNDTAGAFLSTKDNWARMCVDFASSSTLEVGLRDVTGVGSWDWDSTPANYDGAFPGAADLNTAVGLSVPLLIRDWTFHSDRQGKTWVEANL